MTTLGQSLIITDNVLLRLSEKVLIIEPSINVGEEPIRAKY